MQTQTSNPKWLNRLLQTAIATALISFACTPAVADGKQVFGYYTNWSTYGRNFQPNSIPTNDLTALMYAFAEIGNCAPPYATEAQPGACGSNAQNSGIQDYQLHSTDPYSDFLTIPKGYLNAGSQGLGNMSKAIKLMHAQKKPALLSIGGYSLTVPLTSAMTDAHRATFVASVTQFLTQVKADNHLDGFDGVDIDWEPNDNQWSFLNDSNVAYQYLVNYLTFLKALRTELKNHYAKYSWLTVALPASPEIVEKANAVYPGFWQEVANTVDYMDVMSYDYHGAFDQPKITNLNAPMLFDKLQPQQTIGREHFNVQSTVAAYLAAQVPAQKLVIGLPTYGRALSGVANLSPTADQPMPGLYQPFEGAYQGQYGNDGIYDYRYIQTTLLKAGFTAYHVDNAGETAAYNPQQRAWLSFDSVQDIVLKTTRLRDQNVAGVMFWELSGDIRKTDANYTTQSLIHTAATQFGLAPR